MVAKPSGEVAALQETLLIKRMIICKSSMDTTMRINSQEEVLEPGMV
jgi:hypothetical protein